MSKELALTSPTTTFKEIQKATFFVADKRFDTLSIPLGFVNYLKPYLETMPSVDIAIAIDFPYGIEMSDMRQAFALKAIHHGARILDIPVNNHLAVNDNWKAFKEDANVLICICKDKDVEPRFILDYRLFDTEIVVQICKTLGGLGAMTVITTSGVGADEPYDNIIMAQAIKAKTDLSVIVCSSMLREKHLELLKSSQLGGFRLTSLGMAERLFGSIGV